MPGADGNKAGSAWEEAKKKATRPGTKEVQSTSRSGCLHYPLGDMEHKVRSRIQAFACVPICLALICCQCCQRTHRFVVSSARPPDWKGNRSAFSAWLELIIARQVKTGK